MSKMRLNGFVLIVIAAELLLSACGGKAPEPEPAPTKEAPAAITVKYGIPVVGACYGDDRLKAKAKAYENEFSKSLVREMRNSPTFNDKVECNAPHMFEVLNILDIPQDLTGDFKVLLNPSTIEHANIRRWANEQCSMTMTPKATEVNAGLPWQGATVSPALPTQWEIKWFLTEPEAFNVKPQVTCLLVNDSMKSISSKQVLTSFVPATDRLCFSTGATTLGDCNLPHEFERFGVIEWDKNNGGVIQPQLGQGEVTPKFESYVQEALLKGCNALMLNLGAKTRASTRLNVTTENWPNEIGVYRIYCETASTEEINNQPVKYVGSIFDKVPAPTIPTPAPTTPAPTPTPMPTPTNNIQPIG